MHHHISQDPSRSTTPEYQESPSQKTSDSTKKPPTLAFGMWRADNQKKFDEMYPNKLPFEVVTKMKTAWRHHIPAEERDYYFAKERQLKIQRDNPSMAPTKVESPPRSFEVAREVESPKPQEEYVKRPLNPYMIFFRKRRADMSITEPNLPSSEICKRLGAAWANMSAAEKKPFYDEAGKLKKQVYEEHPNYKFHPRKRPAAQISETPTSTMTPIRPTSSSIPHGPPSHSQPSSPMRQSSFNMPPQQVQTPHTPSNVPPPGVPAQRQQVRFRFPPCLEYPRTSGRAIREGQENYGASYLPVWF
ncbi:hypothetical protein L5515_015324 [Caenorhabditis briggsae]|uniref:Sex-determining region Y protein n=2 Tax=Caenorhabditis briggsae TaxID=6238 RepID=A0AAE9DMA6_CAEBR|nr:hypothetical protein L3Y34_019198 [Caenorhabditis briggsae]UMM19918.1 hypothetical protein L5515_015324 [Caenorhabditis briggsae]